MKKNVRFLSLIIILTLTLQLAQLTPDDTSATNDHSQNTKSIVEGYTYLTHGLFFTQENGKAYQKLPSTSLQVVFGTQSSLPKNAMAQLSSKRILIDIRQKIKNILSNQFYGSKYITSNPLI